MFLKKVAAKYRVVSDTDEHDEQEEHDKPDEYDAFLAPSGPLGSRTSLSVDHKFIGEFKSDEEAEEALVAWMKKNELYPGVWQVSDHGNVHPYELSEKSKKALNFK